MANTPTLAETLEENHPGVDSAGCCTGCGWPIRGPVTLAGWCPSRVKDRLGSLVASLDRPADTAPTPEPVSTPSTTDLAAAIRALMDEWRDATGMENPETVLEHLPERHRSVLRSVLDAEG